MMVRLADAGLSEGADRAAPENAERAPVPLRKMNLPTFPVAVLPPVLASFVSAASSSTQTPPDLAAFMSLATISTVISKRVRVRVRGAWHEPTNLYLAGVLQSGTRKTAVVEVATAPIFAWVRRVRAGMDGDVRELEMRKRLADDRSRRAFAQAARKWGDEAVPLEEEFRRLQVEASALRVPVRPCLLADDDSPAALLDLMSEQGGRIAYLSDEGGVLDAIGRGRLASGKSTLDFFLKAHSGGPIVSRRKNRQPIEIERPAVVFGVCVQPEVLRMLAARHHLRGVGLLARFCFAVPESNVGRREATPPLVNDDAVAAYASAIEALLDGLPDDRDDRGEITSRVLDLDPDAAALLCAFAADLEPRLARDGDLGPIADWGGKLAGTAARVAANLHMLECADSVGRGVPPIPEATMASAIEIAKYMIEHAKAAFGIMGADPELDDAEEVLRWIRRDRPSVFSAREAFERVKGRLHTMRRLGPALDILQDHGFIAPVAGPSSRRRGRPASPRYAVRPGAFDVA